MASDLDDLSAAPADLPLRWWTLALLAEFGPVHGYELWWQLSARGHTTARTPGGVHRALRELESDGLASAEWEIPDYGPARRVYTVTPQGRRALRDLPV